VKITTNGSQANDIDVNEAVTWASVHRLTLDAYHSISIIRPISVTGTGGLTLTTNDGGTGGVLSFTLKGSVTFWNLTSSLIINGNAYTLVGNVATLASDITASPNGNYALAANYDATADGTYSQSPIQTAFGGTFEGLGNTISHVLIVDLRLSDMFGLFTDVTGTIADLHLTAIHYVGHDSFYEGGLVARNDGLLLDDSVSGRIGGQADAAGGLVGYNNGTIRNSFSTCTVLDGGGLVGINVRNIDSSYATGSATDGGLVVESSGSITNSYATGSVTKGAETGGLVGLNYGSISSSYSMGSVSSSGKVGGFVGDDETSGEGITSSYWDTTTSGIANSSQGAGNVLNDPGITGETTTQLQAGLPVGFNPAIWGESPSINGGLPYLLENSPKK
jgi:hypothetical protein